MSKFKPGDIVYWEHIDGTFEIEKVLSIKQVIKDGTYTKDSIKSILKYHPNAIFVSSNLDGKKGYTGWMLKEELHHYTETFKILFDKRR